MPLRHMLTASIAASLVLTVAGCQADPVPKPPLEPVWQEISLPVPPGPGDRIMLRESVQCAGKWYLFGGVGDPTTVGDYGMETRPAVWVSDNGSQWRSVPLAPRDYYGERSVLYSADCRNGVIAVIGSKTGGAHGNPRVSTWYQRQDGSLIQVLAPFELYNGPNFMNVARMVAGPSGWLIAGNRMPGAAVWLSPDATEFRIIEGAPELASDSRGETWGADAAAVPGGWMVVGGILLKGRTERDPISFTSKDGTSWTRTEVAASPDYEEFQRVRVSGDAVWAAGVSGAAFGAWRFADGKWQQTGKFGTFGGTAAPSVKSLFAHGSGLIMAGNTGSAHEVWASTNGHDWRQVALPAPAPVAAEKTISINDHNQRILLLIDDGHRGRAWFGSVSVTF